MGSEVIGIAKVIKDYGKAWEFQSQEIVVHALGLSWGLRGNLLLLMGFGRNHA